nr:MAG TPA: hypothetical protein [Caudoviricetes sp.]
MTTDKPNKTVTLLVSHFSTVLSDFLHLLIQILSFRSPTKMT